MPTAHNDKAARGPRGPAVRGESSCWTSGPSSWNLSPCAEDLQPYCPSKSGDFPPLRRGLRRTHGKVRWDKPRDRCKSPFAPVRTRLHRTAPVRTRLNVVCACYPTTAYRSGVRAPATFIAATRAGEATPAPTEVRAGRSECAGRAVPRPYVPRQRTSVSVGPTITRPGPRIGWEWPRKRVEPRAERMVNPFPLPRSRLYSRARGVRVSRRVSKPGPGRRQPNPRFA